MKTRLEQSVRRIEVEIFPELAEDEYAVPIKNPLSQYFEFTPSHHFRSQLITETILDNLKKSDKTLLSVGCGSAYLERLLAIMGVDKRKITLGDKYPENTPPGFEFYPFDMHDKWPNFGRIFDYVIFPESLCSLVRCKNEEYFERMAGLLSNSFQNIKPGGEVRFDGYGEGEKFREIFRKSAESVKTQYPNARLMFRRNLMIAKK